MEFDAFIIFSEAAMAASPELSQLQFPISEPRIRSALLHIHRGDCVRIQGVPSEPALYVHGRVWTLMNDETRLVLALGLIEEV